MISFLPLAHMLERTCENGVYYSGAAVGFYSGNIRDLTQDLKALRPTIMPAVPRLLNRVYDKFQSDLASSTLRRLMFSMAIKSKEAELKRQILRRNSIWDKLVFRQVQECESKTSAISDYVLKHVNNAFRVLGQLLAEICDSCYSDRHRWLEMC